MAVANFRQDREAEPRFGPTGGAVPRGGFGGGMGGGMGPGGPGGYGGGPGFGAPMGGMGGMGGPGGGGRQIYISNVCPITPTSH